MYAVSLYYFEDSLDFTHVSSLMYVRRESSCQVLPAVLCQFLGQM